MDKTLTISDNNNKITISGEGFLLLQNLLKRVKKMESIIEKNNDFLFKNGKFTDKQKEKFEELKEDYLLLKNIHDKFKDIITENSVVLMFLQKIGIDLKSIFPGEVKKMLMPSQVEKLNGIIQQFEAIQEIYNKHKI